MKKNLDRLQFSGDLIPAVIQDHLNKEVLMVAYMNRESLLKTLETGETHFWSRSRKRLWRKGETSGHIQKVRKIMADCDRDTLLIEVEQVGVACHTGKRSCFFEPLGGVGRRRGAAASDPSGGNGSFLHRLDRTISDRKADPSAQSYTTQLFRGGIDRILKKVGEEAGELIISAKNRSKKGVVHEAADLLYHLLVALNYRGISLAEIEAELERRSSRSGLAEKRSRGTPSDTKGRSARGKTSKKGKQ